MNVKEKALALVTFVILSLSGFFLLQGISRYNKDIERTILTEEEILDRSIRDIQKYVFTPYRIRIKHLVENREDLAEAFARRDRDRLYRLARPVYDRLTEENDYFHAWDFNLPDGTVFLRVQKPGLHGDNISRSRSIVQAVHDTKKQLAGFDIGKHGAIYWIAQPVYHDGTYVGATEFGIPVKQLVNDLGEKFNMDVTTLVRADEWNKATLFGKGFRQFGDQVLMTARDSIYNRIPDTFLFDMSCDQRMTLNGRTHVLHSCATLKSHEGRTMGYILVLQDISEKIAAKRRFVIISIIVAGLLICTSLGLLYLSFGSLIGKLEASAEETRIAKEEAEGARSQLEKRVSDRTSELNEANASLREQHAFLQAILASLTHPFYVIDASNYHIIMANAAARASHNTFSEPLTCYSMTHNRSEPCTGEDHPCSLKEVMKTRRPQLLEHIHADRDGTSRYFEIHAYPVMDKEGKVIQVIEYCVDITERKQSEEEREKLEAQLQQAQKMEAMGTLAGGIAHDFNNILSAIFGFTDLIRYELPEDSDIQGKLNEVLKAGNRAKDLVRQILTFSRQAEQERKPFQIHLLIKEALKLLRASIPVTIEFREDIADCGLVLADPTQIHQVVMNLCTNAYHAMREDRGILAVSLAAVEISTEDCKVGNLTMLPGHYVKLSVSDTGHGIERSTIDRIFDPYFTTKKVGEGTGMGLAVVHGIVKSHGGHITVYSEVGAGTTFNIYLPCFEATKDVQRALDPDKTITAIEPLPGGTERIMLVDDEKQLVEAERQMLESLGYKVDAFTGSVEALRAFSAKKEAYDLVITDMTMPSLTGAELAQNILSLRRDIPIVLCTGFSETMDRDKAKMLGIRQFVMKPIVKADIARIVRKVLDGTVQGEVPDKGGGNVD